MHNEQSVQKKDAPKGAEEGHAPAEEQGAEGLAGPPVQAQQASGAGAAQVMSHWAEGVQMKKDPGDKDKPKKTEGDALEKHMGPDERFSAERDVVQNGTGRILGISVSSAGTRIMIGLGRKQGVFPGMEGYVKKGDGMLADFQIEDATERTSHATVDVTPDMLKDHDQVMVNPSHKPKSSESQKDMKARLINLSVVGGRTQIGIGRGVSHGARYGMAGYLVGSGGRPFARFTIDEAHSTHSTAFVDHTLDAVREHTDIILNPSGG